jgi:hypothetical protein
MSLEGPILAATIRNLEIPTRTSTLFCNVLFGLCEVPSVSNLTLHFPKPKPRASRPAASGKHPIEVVHISDVHVDLSYQVGSSYNCTVGHHPSPKLIYPLMALTIRRKLFVADHMLQKMPLESQNILRDHMEITTVTLLSASRRAIRRDRTTRPECCIYSLHR